MWTTQAGNAAPGGTGSGVWLKAIAGLLDLVGALAVRALGRFDLLPSLAG